MEEVINNLKKEFSIIISPSLFEVIYISFLVIIAAFFISLSIVCIDHVIGSIINSILFS